MLTSFDFDIPSSGNVPVCHVRPSFVVGYATVDEWLLGLVTELGPWYVADVREPASPRIAFRLDGAKRYLNLSRVVVLVTKMTEKQRAEHHSIESLYNLARELPPVRFSDRNHFNCQFDNLIVGGFRSLTPLTVKPSQLAIPSPVSLVPAVVPSSGASGSVHQIPPSNEVNNIFDLESTDPLALEEFPAQSDTVKDVKSILGGD